METAQRQVVILFCPASKGNAVRKAERRYTDEHRRANAPAAILRPPALAFFLVLW